MVVECEVFVKYSFKVFGYFVSWGVHVVDYKSDWDVMFM